MWLSKSRFIAGWQCLKRLYLEVHQPELAAEPDEQSMAVFEQGHEVGRCAQKMFPGGVLIEATPEEMNKALRQTEQAVADKQHPARIIGSRRIMLSSRRHEGRHVLRFCVLNHRSRKEDIRAARDIILELGEEVEQSMSAHGAGPE